MDDDFGDDINDTNNNRENDFMLEQRSTDRMREEIKSNGYRDGYQKHFEDEKLMQIGFDIAYKRLSAIAFLCGQIKSMAAYSSVFGKDSAFLARLNDKLDKIEHFKFDNLLEWQQPNSPGQVPMPNEQNLIRFLDDYQQKLLKLSECLATYSVTKGASNKIDLEALSMEARNDSDEADVNAEAERVEKDLNSLIENLNF